MAAMAGALRVQLEKPGQYILGDTQEPLTGNKILDALRIRDVTIVLWALLCVGVIIVVRLFFLPI
jgi:cobalamin biosynthesis protein CobD/CbiB